jgi:transposase InsO family protein
MWHHKSVIVLFRIVLRLLIDLLALTAVAFRQRRATSAEILVLRRQIALYKERGIRPRRIDPATRISLALLVSASASAGPTARGLALVDLPAPARPRNHSVRFPHRLTATFRLLYVFVVSEHRSRRLIHCNITAHPSAIWTLQQLREAIGFQDQYEYLLHDRDSIFAKHLDESIVKLGVKVLKSPPRSPTANAICERVIGTIRRECLDWLIPLSESHLRSILKSWIPHYNAGRPHMALGPGIPDPPPAYRDQSRPNSSHRRGESYAVGAKSILGGLHREYFLAPACA